MTNENIINDQQERIKNLENDLEIIITTSAINEEVILKFMEATASFLTQGGTSDEEEIQNYFDYVVYLTEHRNESFEEFAKYLDEKRDEQESGE